MCEQHTRKCESIHQVTAQSSDRNHVFRNIDVRNERRKGEVEMSVGTEVDVRQNGRVCNVACPNDDRQADGNSASISDAVWRHGKCFENFEESSRMVGEVVSRILDGLETEPAENHHLHQQEMAKMVTFAEQKNKSKGVEPDENQNDGGVDSQPG